MTAVAVTVVAVVTARKANNFAIAYENEVAFSGYLIFYFNFAHRQNIKSKDMIRPKCLIIAVSVILISLCCSTAGGESGSGQPVDKTELYRKEAGTVRLVSYNVGVFSKYLDNSTSLVATLMDELDADAIAVNELDYYNTRHDTDQLKVLAEELGDWDYLFGKAIDFAGGEYGEGAVVRSSLGVQEKYSVPLPQGEGAEARVLGVIETRDFVFASTHLDHVSDKARTGQAALISSVMMEKYGDTAKPVFLCGDLNSTPGSAPINELKKNWTILSVSDPTFPSDDPNTCIDYVMVLNNGAKYARTATAVCYRFLSGDVAKASDHLPIFVDVRLQ